MCFESLNSKVGLAEAKARKAAALRINLDVDGCCIVAAQVHTPLRGRFPFPPPGPSFFHTTFLSEAGTNLGLVIR